MKPRKDSLHEAYTAQVFPPVETVRLMSLDVCLFMMAIFICSAIHGLLSELVLLLFEGIQTSRAVFIVELKKSTLVSIFSASDRSHQASCQGLFSFKALQSLFLIWGETFPFHIRSYP